MFNTGTSNRNSVKTLLIITKKLQFCFSNAKIELPKLDWKTQMLLLVAINVLAVIHPFSEIGFWVVMGHQGNGFDFIHLMKVFTKIAPVIEFCYICI